MSASVAIPVRRTRLGYEWRALVELWWWPLVVALLPYRLGLALAAWLARHVALYETAARDGLAHWREVRPGGDDADWLAQFRFAKLIDHADLFWAATRSEAFLMRQLPPLPEPSLGPGPLVVVSFHYGQGLWLMRWLRAQGANPRFLSVPSVREGADSTLMFLYGRLRIRVVERLAGIAPIFVGGARRTIGGALRAGETVYGLVDVPVQGAEAIAANCRVFDRPVLFPMGVLESARGTGARAVVLTGRVDPRGARVVDLDVIGDADAVTMPMLARALEKRLVDDAPAWHLWNVWPAFVARGPAPS